MTTHAHVYTDSEAKVRQSELFSHVQVHGCSIIQHSTVYDRSVLRSCFVTDSTIGYNCSVGHGAEIVNSLILPGTHIPDRARVSGVMDARLEGVWRVHVFHDVGLHYRTLTAIWHSKGLLVRAGCYAGKLAELRKAVAKKYTAKGIRSYYAKDGPRFTVAEIVKGRKSYQRAIAAIEQMDRVFNALKGDMWA